MYKYRKAVKKFEQKNARKMLMKLTPVADPIKLSFFANK
jgi:hypothetical protein